MPAPTQIPPPPPQANLPEPPRDHGSLAVGLGLLASGLGVLVLALSGALTGSVAKSSPAPPPIRIVAPTPAAAPAGAVLVPQKPADTIVDGPKAGSRAQALPGLRVPVTAAWMSGFYPLYATASRTFAVNWLLLASIHEQETAFSTAPGTYHGLNFAGCCGGPMQFNVRNGPVTTWQRVSDSYRYAPRPAAYPHPTRTHPSIYDDFDAVMAAARLLSANGARTALDFHAWSAAYFYYGPSIAGVTYADQVLARAIGWSQHGFCANCGINAALLAAVHAAYGAPVLAALSPPPAPAPKKKSAGVRGRGR